LYSKIFNKHKCVLNMLLIRWKNARHSNESGKLTREHCVVHTHVIIVAWTIHLPVEVEDMLVKYTPC